MNNYYISITNRCNLNCSYCDNSCACRKMASAGCLNQVSEAFCIEQQILILTQLEKMKRV